MKKLISLIIIFSFVLYGCSKENSQDSSYAVQNSNLTTTYIEKPATGRPKNQKPIDNIFIALNILNTASSYESTSNGEVVAKKGSVKLATQQIKNRRAINTQAIFSESISISSFVKVAEQIYINENNVLKREAKKVSNQKITWENEANRLTNTQYIKQYGYSPKDPSRYIINEETIIGEIETISNGIGRTFTYKFKLNPLIAPYYYKTAVKYLSGSSSEPVFKSIELQLSFNYKWQMTRIEVNEEYEVEISALGKVTCSSTLTETFKNINKKVTLPEQDFFTKHL